MNSTLGSVVPLAMFLILSPSNQMLPCAGTKGKTGRAGRGSVIRLLPSLATSSYNTPIIFDKLELNMVLYAFV